MTAKTANARTKSRTARANMLRKYGFYASTFTEQELRGLDAQPEQRPEILLLRTKILRLAKLTPLKNLDEDQLDALIKLVRVVAALDAMERTNVMKSKAEGGADPVLEALAGLDADDL